MSDILGGIGNAVGDLGSAANGLLGGSDPTEVPVANAGNGILDPITGGLGGVVSGVGGVLTSLVPVQTLSIPPVLPLPSANSNSLSANPSASGSIVPASSLGLSSVAPLSSSIPLPSSTPPPSFSSAPQSAAADLDPTTQISTQVVIGAPAATSAPATAPKGFLQNKPLAGAVFGLAGLVGLVLIFVIATWAMRRKRRGRLMDEAISFEPTAQHSYAEDMERLNEKRNSTESYGRSYGATAGYNVNQAQAYPAYNQPFPQYSSPSQLVNGGYTGR